MVAVVSLPAPKSLSAGELAALERRCLNARDAFDALARCLGKESNLVRAGMDRSVSVRRLQVQLEALLTASDAAVVNLYPFTPMFPGGWLMNDLRYESVVASAKLIAQGAVPGDLATIGVSDDDFRRFTGDSVWTIKDRPRCACHGCLFFRRLRVRWRSRV